MSKADERDYDAVRLIGRWKQLKASQLHQIGFYPASLRSCQRSLESLHKAGFVTPFKLRGDGGNPPFVWALDKNGLDFMPEGYKLQHSVNKHTLEIADTFIEVLKLQRSGRLTLIDYLTEPACHEKIDGNKIEDDLYTAVELPDGQPRHTWWEVDRGYDRYSSESDKHIKDKLRRYVEAAHYTGDFWPDYLLVREPDGSPVYDRIALPDGTIRLDPARWFPKVVWLVQNEWRARVIQRLINHLAVEDRGLFKICLRTDIAGMFA